MDEKQEDNAENEMSLIGLWKFIRALCRKNNMWALVNETGTNSFVPKD
jgi:hypothetical protein